MVNAKGLHLECARVLHEALLMPVLLYGSRTILKEKRRSKIRVVQMDTLRCLLGIMKMY